MKKKITLANVISYTHYVNLTLKKECILNWDKIPSDTIEMFLKFNLARFGADHYRDLKPIQYKKFIKSIKKTLKFHFPYSCWKINFDDEAE